MLWGRPPHYATTGEFPALQPAPVTTTASGDMEEVTDTVLASPLHVPPNKSQDEGLIADATPCASTSPPMQDACALADAVRAPDNVPDHRVLRRISQPLPSLLRRRAVHLKNHLHEGCLHRPAETWNVLLPSRTWSQAYRRLSLYLHRTRLWRTASARDLTVASDSLVNLTSKWELNVKSSVGILLVLARIRSAMVVLNPNGPKNLDPLLEGRTVRRDMIKKVSPGHIP
ncbi:hypothetical protein HPB52_022499 [Rhipicephalus sanguineus]|uniref:Uncharacterized protein n=1 Tax=Rhipicephalus sanguineus TaxID=34632 RepID=A0A9D4SRH3_RHISA|nr:hypothetical protein HPB52_022499 [Rhipicephalus sanguineus]